MIPAFLAPAFTIPAVALSAFAGGYLWLKMIHEPNIRSAYAAEITLQTEREKARLQTLSIQVLEAQAEAQKARDAADQAIRRSIARAPQTTSCASSPAMRAALDGLRAATPSHPAPTHPAKPSDLPAGTQTR